MIVAILNYTGTVGKTTIAAHLLSPRMNNAPIFAIESINETAAALGVDVEKMGGDKFHALLKRIMLENDAIIDIGASNIEEFMNNLIKFNNSHEEISHFLIPVTSGVKEQKETVLMLDTLLTIGIPSEKITVIFNRVENDIDEEFQFIIARHNKDKSFTLNKECAIFENEIFNALAMKGLTVDALLADTTDYKVLLKNNKDASDEERNEWADIFVLKSLARGVKRNLDDVYANIF